MKALCNALFVLSLTVFLLAGCTSPLMQAIEKNDVNGARDLIEKGTDIKEKSPLCYWNTHVGSFKLQCTPLMHAAEYGRNEIINLLLDRGADINEKVEGWTALGWAASSGQIKSVKLLLDKGANISGALAEAVFEGHFDVARFLIDRGADVNAEGKNWEGWSILDVAVYRGFVNIVKLLIERGAKVDDTVTRFEGLSLQHPNDGQYKAALNLAKKYSGKQDAEIQTVTSKPPQVGLSSPIIRSDIDELPAIISEPRKNAYAVVIGIENYRSLPKSDYSKKDATLVKSYLKALGFQERNIDLITDDKATKTDMEKSLEAWLPNRVKKDSTIFIYYSGHGSPDPASGEAYIVPYDGDPNYLAVTGYPLKKLYQTLGKLNAREVVVVLDSCFSGAGGRSVLASGARPLVMMTETAILSSNMAVLTATQGSQISTSSPEKGHGIFTYYFLKAIKEGKRNLNEIYEYIKPQVEDEAKQLNVQQSPSISPSVEKIKGPFSVWR